MMAIRLGIFFFLATAALALTPVERAIVRHAKEQLEIAIQHGRDLRTEAESARSEADKANVAAGAAGESAMTSDTKAKLAEALEQRQFNEFVRSEKENAKMRPIVAAVSGPWWFPGLNALFYGIKKCALSLVIVVAGLVVIFLVLTLAIPGLRPILGAVGGFFGRLWKWVVALSARKGKAVVDDIEHKTIGSDPPDKTP